jgi:hypothetical protein
MTRRRVGEDLDAVQAHQDVRSNGELAVHIVVDLANGQAHEAGVKSSSHSSTPITVSSVATTASPKGTEVYPGQPSQTRSSTPVLPDR